MKRILLLIIFVFLLIFGAGGLYMEIKEYSDGEEEYIELEQYVSSGNLDNEVISSDNNKQITNVAKLAPDEITVDFDGLKKVNSDCIAWLLIPGTNINYPVVSGIDNSYYVTHTFKKTTNKSGAIFTDMRNSLNFLDKNTIIYVHNLKNNKMFSDLKKFLTKSYFDNHKRIVVYTENKELVYVVFAVCKTMEDSDIYKVRFSTDEEFSGHIDMVVDSSMIEVLGENQDIKRIITLSACTNNLEGERVVVIAKLVD